MDVTDLRIILYSGNYNYVRDGANQALNKLVEYLLRQGAAVRVYAPTIQNPAFEPAGDLVSIPSIAFPGREEYRLSSHIPQGVKNDIRAFAPNMVHLSSPDLAAHSLQRLAHNDNIPVLASVHTRFETYPSYYNLKILEPVIYWILKRFYNKCDALVAPSQSMADLLRDQGMNDDVGIWSRGVDKDLFGSCRRDQNWRRSIGLKDDIPVIGFLGRLVMEKGLDVFSETLHVLNERNIDHQILVIGEGPARPWFEDRLPHAKFIGFQKDAGLAGAVASMDILFNPSTTETFGNVTLEAMASGVPVVAAEATGSKNLVQHDHTGQLIRAGDTAGFADALQQYCDNPALRKAHGASGEKEAEKFSWDVINKSVSDSYIRLAK